MSTDTVVRQLEQALRSAGSELREEEKRLLDAASPWPGPTVELAAAIYSARLTEASLREHATALRGAAEAANKYAAKLAKATWALVGLTAVLAAATVVGLFR